VHVGQGTALVVLAALLLGAVALSLLTPGDEGGGPAAGAGPS
jgi:hypothetical protein